MGHRGGVFEKDSFGQEASVWQRTENKHDRTELTERQYFRQGRPMTKKTENTTRTVPHCPNEHSLNPKVQGTAQKTKSWA